MCNNELLDCVEHDMIFWLNKSEENNVQYVMRSGNIINIDNESRFTEFKLIKKNFYKYCNIWYNTGKKTIISIFIDSTYNIANIHFSYTSTYHYNDLSSWIEIKDDNFMQFCYFTNIVKREEMGRISSVDEMYSVAKNIELEIVADNHRDKIAKYYDSLPLFKLFLRIFGELPVEQIIIEI